MYLQFVRNDNNGISQTKVTYEESIYNKKATELDLHEIQAVKWQLTVEFNSELKNKLNKLAAEQSKKLSDLKELQSMQFHKNYYIGLSIKKSLPALNVAFQSLPLASSFQKKQVYKFKDVIAKIF